MRESGGTAPATVRAASPPCSGLECVPSPPHFLVRRHVAVTAHRPISSNRNLCRNDRTDAELVRRTWKILGIDEVCDAARAVDRCKRPLRGNGGEPFVVGRHRSVLRNACDGSARVGEIVVIGMQIM